MAQTCYEPGRRATIDRLIITSPYKEPSHHWRYGRETRISDVVLPIPDGGATFSTMVIMPGCPP